MSAAGRPFKALATGTSREPGTLSTSPALPSSSRCVISVVKWTTKALKSALAST
eukprot:CAMPEP_0177260020 /NCGR_PEP_ID=MMETSP0367-20130122/58991_1 /TAXON_ID=447022 ORGANISM="Scrippsiella hangoei-like, Strain SHHI-4" /NCGR_SAMPLE_ID=MMETSP0367 /ASSEMBLY_ACC=CAM_ASM_000362 /LENGTH=53 /DNA_ID=CAMNT_0018714421 /DNA_START=67 /DNA_END=224 /DNA_ORIENTATION=+